MKKEKKKAVQVQGENHAPILLLYFMVFYGVWCEDGPFHVDA